jgi:hypothetical protein
LALLDGLDAESGSAGWALKDPRMAPLAKFWLPLFTARTIPPRHILVLRDPREVATSQMARSIDVPEAYPLLHRAEAMLVLWTTQTFHLLRALREEEILVVAHSELTVDAPRLFGRIAQFAGLRQETVASSEVFRGRYYRSSPAEIAAGGVWTRLSGRLFESLSVGAGSVLQPEDIAAIVRENEEISHAVAYLKPFAGLLDRLERGDSEWFLNDET